MEEKMTYLISQFSFVVWSSSCFLIMLRGTMLVSQYRYNYILLER